MNPDLLAHIHSAVRTNDITTWVSLADHLEEHGYSSASTWVREHARQLQQLQTGAYPVARSIIGHESPESREHVLRAHYGQNLGTGPHAIFQPEPGSRGLPVVASHAIGGSHVYNAVDPQNLRTVLPTFPPAHAAAVASAVRRHENHRDDYEHVPGVPMNAATQLARPLAWTTSKLAALFRRAPTDVSRRAGDGIVHRMGEKDGPGKVWAEKQAVNHALLSLGHPANDPHAIESYADHVSRFVKANPGNVNVQRYVELAKRLKAQELGGNEVKGYTAPGASSTAGAELGDAVKPMVELASYHRHAAEGHPLLPVLQKRLEGARTKSAPRPEPEVPLPYEVVEGPTGEKIHSITKPYTHPVNAANEYPTPTQYDLPPIPLVGHEGPSHWDTIESQYGHMRPGDLVRHVMSLHGLSREAAAESIRAHALARDAKRGLQPDPDGPLGLARPWESPERAPTMADVRAGDATVELPMSEEARKAHESTPGWYPRTGNAVAAPGGPITHSSLMDPTIHPQLRGTSLAYHLKSIVNRYTKVDPHLARTAQNALHGVSGPSFALVGEGLKYHGDKLAKAYNWAGIERGLALDRAVESLVDKHVGGRETLPKDTGNTRRWDKILYSLGSGRSHQDAHSQYDTFWLRMLKDLKAAGWTGDPERLKDLAERSIRRIADREHDRAYLAGLKTPGSGRTSTDPPRKSAIARMYDDRAAKPGYPGFSAASGKKHPDVSVPPTEYAGRAATATASERERQKATGFGGHRAVKHSRNAWIGQKVKRIMNEGLRGRKVSQSQAVAAAYSMWREEHES